MDEALLMQSAVVDVEAASVATATLGYDTKGGPDTAAVRRSRCVLRGVVPTKAAADGSSADNSKNNKQRIIDPFIVIIYLLSSAIARPAFCRLYFLFLPHKGQWIFANLASR